MRSLRVRETGSVRHVLVSGRGVRTLLQVWHVPSVWSMSHRGCHVRRGHLADLQALADLHGVRLLDEREGSS